MQEYGLRPQDVRLCFNDTKTCPNSGLSGGSRSHYMNGNAIIKTAKSMLDAMRKEDGTFRTYDEMVQAGLPTVFQECFDLSNYGLKAIDHDTGQGDSSPTYMYAVFLAEVEVDVKTGKTKVISYTAVTDVGAVGNKLAAEGQAYGGLSHSIGFALTENYDDVKKHNNIVGAGIPTINDIPDDFNIVFCQNKREDGPFGSAGCSEVFQSSGHMAVINAIYNATGVRVFELPASPEKILDGLHKLSVGQPILPPARYYLGKDMYDMIEELTEQ